MRKTTIPQYNKAKPAYLAPLTSLRFFAAMMIVALHSKGNFGIPDNIFGYACLVQGVSFFFMLSGFVLTYNYENFSERTDFISFMVARIARIWPLHVFTLLLSVGLIFKKIYDPVSFYLNLSMIHAWIPINRYFFSYNSLSWAVSTELGLYLCFPLLIRNWDRHWFLKTILVFFSLMAAIVACNYFGIPQNPTSGVGFAGILYISPFGRLLEFCLGMTAALAYRKIKNHHTPNFYLGSVIEITALAFSILMILRSKYFALCLHPFIGAAGRYWVEMGGISSLFFMLLILSIAFNKGIVSKLLSLNPFVFLGKISFELYMIHQILIRYFSNHITGTFGLSNVSAYFIFLVTVFLMSYFAWILIERPCHRWMVIGFEWIKKKKPAYRIG